MKYPLATSSWDADEYAAIEKVVAGGQFTMGEHVKEFEAAFAAFAGSRHCVMVNSGSSANLLAVAALRFHSRYRLAPGDEVIVPAVSWSTTYYPWTQYGQVLKFVDIDPLTLNFDLDALKTAIGEKTRAIQIVNLLGNPNDFDAISRIAEERGLVLIEDNCESMGATYKGRQTGTFGLCGTFSCFFSHHISTMEGGLVVTDDEEMCHLLLSLRAHGWTRQLPKQNHITGERGDDPFYESFRFVLPGYNLRPLELSGAIGLHQIEKLPNLIRARRRNAELFSRRFANHPLVTIQEEIGESSWFGFSLVLRDEAPMARNVLVEALRSADIDCRPIVAGNFTRNPVIKHIPHAIHGSLTNADRIHERGLFVGNHHYDIGEQIDYLHGVVAAAAGAPRR